MGVLGAISVAVAATVAVGIATGAAGAAGKHNWMREYVKLREQAVLERAVGIDRAAALRRKAASKIVGGETAKAKANPFQVALLFKGQPDNAAAQYCGGTLYKPNVVVTAAHCSDFVSANQVQVLTGTQSLDGSGTRRNVSSIIIHPDFDSGTLDSDVAVWILTSNANGIETAELASSSTELSKGKTLATGWGNTETAGFPIDLQQVIVPLQSRNDCNDGDSYNGAVTNNMICAGLDAGGKDTCQGNSGGPLTARLNNTGRLGDYDILTGITSWGIGCADPELFGVYTRVANFRTWIDAQVP